MYLYPTRFIGIRVSFRLMLDTHRVRKKKGKKERKKSWNAVFYEASPILSIDITS
jgi:hypothetical protein